MEYVEIACVVIHKTNGAVRIRLEDDEEAWIPFSQIEDNGEDLKRGYVGQIYVSEWFAEKEGLA